MAPQYTYRPFEPYLWVYTWWLVFSSGGVDVYKWIALFLSIILELWLHWLVREAWNGIGAKVSSSSPVSQFILKFLMTPRYMYRPLITLRLHARVGLPAHIVHQFGLLVALASAWSLTWYHNLRSRVRVLDFAIYPKIVIAPSVSMYRPLERYIWVTGPRTRPLEPTSESLHVLTCLPRHTCEWGCWSV
jgi:hypothetical protein